jgi:hypothetical protein
MMMNNINDNVPDEMRILFLHHSTGQNIWNGRRRTILSKIFGRIHSRLSYKFYKKASLPSLFEAYNKKHNTDYVIDESAFPKKSPYGWRNYPYDYYNIWVKNAGDNSFMEEPTLEILTKKYNVIVFKHCFPVSNIKPDQEISSVDSEYKSLANYRLQYLAIRDKLSQFKETKFIVFTGAARVKSEISEDDARRAKEFFSWVINDWGQMDDNIFIWDFYSLQTEGGLYFNEKNAYSSTNSHPNEEFSEKVSRLLFQRIIDVIKTKGNETTLTGEMKRN